MRSRLMCLTIFGLLCALLNADTNSERFVIVISLDGFSADSFNDTKLPVPALRSLAKTGAVARNMRVVNPSVTWPNHTTLVTGVTPAVHSVLYNGLAVRGGSGEPVRVEPWIDKNELVKAPTVYDLANAAGLTTAEV